jgi:hypothetical protein
MVLGKVPTQGVGAGVVAGLGELLAESEYELDGRGRCRAR